VTGSKECLDGRAQFGPVDACLIQESGPLLEVFNNPRLVK
jgi:hypothetical protein